MRAAAAVLGRLPPRPAAWLGRRLGDAARLALPRRRRVALANLARAFPDASPTERRRMCRESFRHLGTVVVELAGVLARPLEDTLATIAVDGREHLEAAMSSAGRALLLTAHLGNWEMLAAAHRLTPYGLSVVMRPLDLPAVDVLAATLRRKTGVELIDKRGAARPVLEALRRGRMVGILMDQNAARHEGVFVPFFGWPASTSRSVAVLALRTGAPVLPVFVRRDGPGRHRVTIDAPLAKPTTNDSEASIVELTRRCNEAIERAIRRAPEQWLWIHERWRTRPPDESW